MTTRKVVVTFTQKEALAARHACSYYRSIPHQRRAQDRAAKKLLRAWKAS